LSKNLLVTQSAPREMRHGAYCTPIYAQLSLVVSLHSGLPTKISYAYLISPMFATCPTHPFIINSVPKSKVTIPTINQI
jgi:hypothetical protein